MSCRSRHPGHRATHRRSVLRLGGCGITDRLEVLADIDRRSHRLTVQRWKYHTGAIATPIAII